MFVCSTFQGGPILKLFLCLWFSRSFLAFTIDLYWSDDDVEAFMAFRSGCNPFSKKSFSYAWIPLVHPDRSMTYAAHDHMGSTMTCDLCDTSALLGEGVCCHGDDFMCTPWPSLVKKHGHSSASFNYRFSYELALPQPCATSAVWPCTITVNRYALIPVCWNTIIIFII